MYLAITLGIVNKYWVEMTSCKVLWNETFYEIEKFLELSLSLKSINKVLGQASHYRFFVFSRKKIIWHQQILEILLCNIFPSSLFVPCWHIGPLNLSVEGVCSAEKSANIKNQHLFFSFQWACHETCSSWLFPTQQNGLELYQLGKCVFRKE